MTTFWKIFSIWFLSVLISFGYYHWTVTQVRTDDFEIQKNLYDEYRNNHALPAYLALSKAHFHAGRYTRDRDMLLQSGTISGYTLNKCDDLVKDKEKRQFFLSITIWVTLFLLFLGFIGWAKVLIGVLGSYFSRYKKQASWKTFMIMTASILILFTASKAIASYFAGSINLKQDFDHSMQVALKMDEYYQLIFDGLLTISNDFYVFEKQKHQEQQLQLLEGVQTKIVQFHSNVKSLALIKSEMLDFDSTELIETTLKLLGKFENLLGGTKEWVVNPANDELAVKIQYDLKETSGFYEDYLRALFSEKEVVISDNIESYFLPEAKKEFKKMASQPDQQTSRFASFGFFLYRAFGYLSYD